MEACLVGHDLEEAYISHDFEHATRLAVRCPSQCDNDRENMPRTVVDQVPDSLVHWCRIRSKWIKSGCHPCTCNKKGRNVEIPVFRIRSRFPSSSPIVSH